MKKRVRISFLLTVLLAVAFCIGLTSCAGKEAGKQAIAPEEISVSTMLNIQTDKAVSLGMAKAEVEDVLGEGALLDREARRDELHGDMQEKADSDQWENVDFLDDGALHYSYGLNADGITVTYLDNTVEAISIMSENADSSVKPANWCVKYGITVGSDKEMIFSHFGEQETLLRGHDKSEHEILVFEYCFDADGKPLDEFEEASSLIVIGYDQTDDSVVHVTIQKR